MGHWLRSMFAHAQGSSKRKTRAVPSVFCLSVHHMFLNINFKHPQRLSKYNLMSFKQQQEFSHIMRVLGIINHTNKHFSSYPWFKGLVQKIETIYLNLVFNIAPILFNNLPQSIRGLDLQDEATFQKVLKYYFSRIVPNVFFFFFFFFVL